MYEAGVKVMTLEVLKSHKTDPSSRVGVPYLEIRAEHIVATLRAANAGPAVLNCENSDAPCPPPPRAPSRSKRGPGGGSGGGPRRTGTACTAMAPTTSKATPVGFAIAPATCCGDEFSWRLFGSQKVAVVRGRGKMSDSAASTASTEPPTDPPRTFASSLPR